jgi:hypothetical protein
MVEVNRPWYCLPQFLVVSDSDPCDPALRKLDREIEAMQHWSRPVLSYDTCAGWRLGWSNSCTDLARPARPNHSAMNIPLHEILQDMSTDELRALNDYDEIAESFLSDNFSYRDRTATDSLIADIKAQNLVLARFVSFLFWRFMLFAAVH